MLQAKNFHGSHTSDTIATAIKEMLDQWHIPLNKVHVILRVNASNMKNAMDNMGVRSLGCFAHSLQLVVNEGLLSQRSVSDAITIAVTVLKRLLAKEGDGDAGIKTMKKTLLQAVNNRFDAVEDEPLYALATLLDPRYKDRYFTSAQSAKHAKDALIWELEEDLRVNSTVGVSEATEPQEKVPRLKQQQH
ncbi:zinc finger BED domain-containing protein [Pimephales promelas]|nr:zinc finger BED domain-containing protein [Pimephales promelas]